MGGPVTWLLVCLGNPGKEYEATRHNMGFMAADRLAGREGFKINKLKFRALTGEAALGGERVLVVKPQTYMNLSGEAVKLAGGFYKIPTDHILVIYDDISLPVGKLRVRPKGSAGGHNGIKNIIAHLGTEEFPRIKIGVGAPEGAEQDLACWVTGKPSEAAACMIEKGTAEAMNRFNG